MATAAALFPAAELAARPLEVRVPIFDELKPERRPRPGRPPSWPEALAGLAELRAGDPRLERLFAQARAAVVLHTGEEVYPGPYTYKRFWFRDAVFILHALLALGGAERVRRALAGFPRRQRRDGYFLSQEGEWDANGAVLWLFRRFERLTGETAPREWRAAAARGARWLERKRLPADSGRPEAGLLPAGFSAEHLGPNDFYYWDDFWAVAGLRAAAELGGPDDPREAARFAAAADDLRAAIERSIPRGPHRRFPDALPASPYRRMDAGAIGSIVADYPLQLYPPGDPRIAATADYLRDHSSFGGGFFQDMIHSGINPYLTLHLAQVRLRAGAVAAAWELMDCVAGLASPTGQWPEAVHPRTGGGCMGDGQHVWAAAEWLMMVRHCFLREEGDGLVIAAGVRPEWWRGGEASFGPAATPWGPATVRVTAAAGGARVAVAGDWRGAPPPLAVRLPGCPGAPVAAGPGEFQLPFAP
jgi:hypothetical protein